MKHLQSVLLIVALAVPALAVKREQQYEVGKLVQLVRIDTGSVSERGYAGLLGRGNVRTRNLGHMAAIVATEEGQYVIDPPVSVAASILLGETVDPSKAWFMDLLKPGDPVAFAAKCNKHGQCSFRVPNPDKPGKEFLTTGSFRPAEAKSNALTLCGTGKLDAKAEADLCGKPEQASEQQKLTPEQISAYNAAVATAAPRAAEVSQAQATGQQPTKQATPTPPPVQAPAQALADPTPIRGQDAPKKVETQCRDLADAYNIVGPDEVLVDGKVCKRVKQAAPNPQAEPNL
jgi:hypothetical protein